MFQELLGFSTLFAGGGPAEHRYLREASEEILAKGGALVRLDRQ